MSSLLEKFAGKIDLIYIDPPFATGADFTVDIEIGDKGKEVHKEHSIIEEKAYRDTWGQGTDSFLSMIYERLSLMKELLSDKGAIFVHCDWHVNAQIRLILDEIFGSSNFQNEILWYYYNKLHGARKMVFPRATDTIFYYLKNRETGFNFQHISEERDNPVKKLKYSFIKGKIVNDKDESGKAITYISTERQIDNVWRIRCLQPANKREWLDFPTQKPENLIQRILESTTNEGDLVADFFCGSGTTLTAAEKLNRRWIGVDLGRFAIHTTRKRLLNINTTAELLDESILYSKNAKPFEILNLGKYERQFWQVKAFNRKDEKQALYEYLAFILKLYGAEPIAGSQYIHGKKGSDLVYIGSVDSPVTVQEVQDALSDTKSMGMKELHVLGWEWEMGLNDAIQEVAKQMGIRLKLRIIPMDVLNEQAINKKDIKFFELAYFKADLKVSNRNLSVELNDFVIPHTDLIPEEVQKSITKWSDWIDYWAIDFDFQNDTFNNTWTSYRTKQNRKLVLNSEKKYDKPGKYKVYVKIIDIFGIDTSQVFDITVK